MLRSYDIFENHNQLLRVILLLINRIGLEVGPIFEYS